MNNNISDTFAKIFAILNGLLVICTLVLNPMVLYVCLRSKKLKSKSTFKLLTFSAVNDILVCLGWSQESFTTTILNYSTADFNLSYCRVVSVFLQFTTLQISSWMLVSISLDRLLTMMIRRWKKHHFTGFRPYIYASILTMFIISLNFNEIFTGGYSSFQNDTEIVYCWSNPPGQFQWYDLMSKILVYFGFITPYVLLIIINSMIIFIVTRVSQAQKAAPSNPARMRRREKNAQLTKTILFITFFYILLSLPGAILTSYYYDYVSSLNTGLMIINLINAIQFSYSALNLFILYFSNRMFAKEVKSVVFKLKPNNNDLHTLKTYIH